MSIVSCHSCGAKANGAACSYCGAQVKISENIKDERDALENFHQNLMEMSNDQQDRILRNGFIPTNSSVLIDAGIKCIALIDNSSTFMECNSAIITRLKAITTKLKLLPGDEFTGGAVKQFTEYSKEWKKRDFNTSIQGLIMLAAIGWLIYYGIR